jgi:hypothetical protein
MIKMKDKENKKSSPMPDWLKFNIKKEKQRLGDALPSIAYEIHENANSMILNEENTKKLRQAEKLLTEVAKAAQDGTAWN